MDVQLLKKQVFQTMKELLLSKENTIIFHEGYRSYVEVIEICVEIIATF